MKTVVKIQKPVKITGEIIIQNPKVKPLFPHRFKVLSVSWKGIAVTSETIENKAQKGDKTRKAQQLINFSKRLVFLGEIVAE